MNRVAIAIERARPLLAEKTEEERTALHAALALDFQEHFEFQEMQARAHVTEQLTVDEALIIYAALGEVGSPSNGGWAAETDLATKVVVTQLMLVLMERRIQEARA